ncbi:MAG: EscU/YscU/HrcU family type III secretion system export apparatus switch protein [Woeseiaceae bacterium]
MSNSDGGGEKREKATPRRLRDARKQGQVSSSRDLSRTATSFVWLLLLILLPAPFYARLASLAQAALAQVGDLDVPGLLTFSWQAGGLVLYLSALPIALVAVVGVLVTRLQTGPVFATDRIMPKLSNISPAAGIKRVFSAANLFETVKGLIKTAVIFGFVALIVKTYANDIRNLVTQPALIVGEVDHWLHVLLLAATSAALFVVSVGDWLFQKFDFLRKLRMNTEEIRRERKSHEGDPQLRSQRRRLQRQWATGSARQAARDATALVVNPTHVAVALFYEPDSASVPVVTGAAEGQLAALMRLEAETAGVPVLQSIPLARSLYFVCEDDDEVPERLFDAVAEVLAWAISAREAAEAGDDVSLIRKSDRAFDALVDTV